MNTGNHPHMKDQTSLSHTTADTQVLVNLNHIFIWLFLDTYSTWLSLEADVCGLI